MKKIEKSELIRLNRAEYRDKVYACWLGKNIGGTMGAPYEGRNEMQDIKGFSSEPGKPLPNDDLDLQLVWLAAVERCGIQQINAQTLGEFWLSFVGPHWNEYGIGKANMKMGLLPPFSGDYHNHWKDSNGAWIRTEIWACLEAGRPDFAAKFARDDAFVDHGVGEGTYAAMFVSAMQAAAFTLENIRECIDVGLSKIPAESRVGRSVRFAIECYEKGMTLADARNAIQKSNADIGDGWFEAPSNVAYTILGLLYGEGDFKKSMIAAINCGDDTDCTGATVGATLGILYGTRGIPEDWAAYIGDEIITVCIDKGTYLDVPKTCTELTERVIRASVHTLTNDYLYPDYDWSWQRVEMTDEEGEIPSDLHGRYLRCPATKELTAREYYPHSVTLRNTVVSATLSLSEGADVKVGESKKMKLYFRVNGHIVGNIPQRLTVRWWLPDGWRVEGKQMLTAEAPNDRRPISFLQEEEYTLTVSETVSPINPVVLELTPTGRVSPLYIPVQFMG